MSGNEQIAVSRHSSKDPTSLFLVAQSFIPVLSKEMEKNLKQHRSDLFPFRCKHHTFVIGEESQSLYRRLLFKKRRSCSTQCRSFYHVSIHPEAISTLPCSSGTKENWSCATTATRVNQTTLHALKSLLKCGRCWETLEVRVCYCSKQCQIVHYGNHKLIGGKAD